MIDPNPVPSVASEWLNEFRSPPVSYRPMAFWSWNEVLEPAELRRQIDLFADAGWGGAFLHSRPGLVTPYMKDQWFDAVAATLEQSRRRGVQVWLYDEDGWPSGVAGGAVVQAGVEHRIKTLCARPIDVAPPPGCVPIGKPARGLQVYAWTSPAGDARYRGLSYADMLSRATVRKFIDEAYEPYHARFSADYGTLIQGEFFDEPRIVEHFGLLPGGPIAYSNDLLARFRQLHGYDPSDRLHLLFDDGPGAARLRLHYFRTTSDLYERNFAEQLSTWCAQHHIALTGHFMSEESVFAQQLMGVKIMPAARHLQIPGIDHLARQVDEILTAKQCQSVVNQYGHARMLSELYGAGGYNTTFEDRLWIAHQQLCFGVNLFVPHLALYTMTGGRKADCPPNLFYQQPWWSQEKPLADRLSRFAVALTQGRYVADALVLHPQESAFVVWKATTRFDAPDALVRHKESLAITPESRNEVDALDRQLKSVMNVLLASQRTFDLGDEQILADLARIIRRNGAPPLLRVGRMGYELVILPSMVTIAPATLALLREFVSAGGVVLRCGQAPSLLDGEPSQDLDRWMRDIASVDLTRLRYVLDDVAPASVEYALDDPKHARHVYTHVRQLADGRRLVFITNLSRTQVCAGELLVRGDWASACELDAATGATLPIPPNRTESGIAFACELASTQARLFLLSTDVAPATPATPRAACESIELTSWTVERLDPNALVLDELQFRIGESEWSDVMPVGAAQQRLTAEQALGKPVTFRYRVRVDKLSRGRPMQMVIERIEHFSVRVNDRSVRYDGSPFLYDFRWLPVDITDHFTDGENTIDVHADALAATDLAELSAAYVFGEFSVLSSPAPGRPASPKWTERGMPLPDVTYLARNTLVMTDPLPLHPGDLTPQRLPFYAGRLRMTTSLPAGRYRLRLDSLHAAVASVRCDGQDCAPILQPPLTCDLPEVAEGAPLELTLYGTLRNLIGPHHHAFGEPDWVDPSTFAFNPSTWQPDYAVVRFGAGAIRLERRA